MDTNEFPFIIDVGHIRCSVAHYKRHIESCVAIISKVYFCCGLFISSILLVDFLRFNPVIVIVLDKNTINIAFLDHYDQEIDEY